MERDVVASGDASEIEGSVRDIERLKVIDERLCLFRGYVKSQLLHAIGKLFLFTFHRAVCLRQALGDNGPRFIMVAEKEDNAKWGGMGVFR